MTYTDNLQEALDDRDFLEHRLAHWGPKPGIEKVREALKEVDETIKVLEAK